MTSSNGLKSVVSLGTTKKLRVLVACEESQAVCIAFRELGHEAFSCDILNCSGGHPEWHIQDNVLKILEPSFNVLPGFCIIFETMDGKTRKVEKWDLLIAHPPCTYLAISGNKWFKQEYKNRFPDRERQREEALEFVNKLMNADIKKIAVENPVSVISTRIRKPDQIVHPYFFGDAVPKATCLWLKDLPLLHKTQEVKPEYIIGKRDGKRYSLIHYQTPNNPNRARIRSKTFPGFAKAMAEQWGGQFNG